jgi:hypothetical protein
MVTALLAGLALAAPAAETPTRTCAQRAEDGKPGTFRPGTPGTTRFGPALIYNLDRGDELTTAQLTRSQGRDPFFKMPMALKASKVVVLSIAPASRRYARVAYAGDDADRRRLTDFPVATVIQACPKDQPAFSYAGTVGAATFFPGGFVTDGKGVPRCVGIELRERGKRAVSRRTVPFGAIRC